MNNDATIISPEVNPFAARAAEQAVSAEEKKTRGIFSQVTRHKKRRPELGILFGPPGIGKSRSSGRWLI